MKKLCNLFLCVMLIVTMIPGMAFAEDAGDGSGGNNPKFTLRVKGTNITADEGATLSNDFYNREIELLVDDIPNMYIEPLQLSGNGSGHVDINGPSDGVFTLTPMAGGQKMLLVTCGPNTRSFYLDIFEDDLQPGNGGSNGGGDQGGDSPGSASLWLALGENTFYPGNDLFPDDFYNQPLTVYRNDGTGAQRVDFADNHPQFVYGDCIEVSVDKENDTFMVKPLELGGTSLDIKVSDNERYSFVVDIQNRHLGNGESGGSNGSQNFDTPVRIFNHELQELENDAVFVRELGDDGTFYFVLTLHKDEDPEGAVAAQIYDNYLGMAGYTFNEAEGIVPADMIAISAVTFNDQQKNQLGLNDSEKTYFSYKAVVDNQNLKEMSYLDCGLINGWFIFEDAGGERIQLNQNDCYIAVCGTEFDLGTINWSKENDNMYFADQQGGNKQDEKELRMWSPAGEQAFYLYHEFDNAEIEFRVLSEYSVANNVCAYGDIDVDDMLTVTQVNENWTKLSLKSFGGHNNIIVTATAYDRQIENGDQRIAQSQIVLTKSILFQYPKGTMAQVEDLKDYMAALSKEYVIPDMNYIPFLDDAQDDGDYTVAVNARKGMDKQFRLPYAGGYFGLTAMPADNYELKAVRGIDGNGEVVSLDYVIMQKFYFLVTDPNGGSLEEEANLYQSGEGLQFCDIMGSNGLVEAQAELASYSWNGSTYSVNVANKDTAVAQTLGAMQQWAAGKGFTLTYLDSCMYYDIAFEPQLEGNGADTVMTMNEKFDQVGIVEFVTEEIQEGDLFGAEDDSDAGIKPSDNASENAWGDNDFDDFDSELMDSEMRGDCEEKLNDFYHGHEGHRVVRGYHFEMRNDAGFEGMADVYLPIPDGVDPDNCQIFWMEDGVPVPMPTRHVCIDSKHYAVITTSHFSYYFIAAPEDAVSEDFVEDSDSGSGSSWYPPAVPKDPIADERADASEAVTGYVDAAEYDEAEAEEIAAIIEQAKKDIKAAKSADEIKAIEEAAKAEIDKLETAEEKALIAEVEDTKFKARSKMTTLRGKRAVKITWTVPEGVDFDGFEVYRSTQRFKGFGKEPVFTTTKTSYINNKGLKVGNTYYYKVRAFKFVNDEKVYTEYSYKAFRTIKK